MFFFAAVITNVWKVAGRNVVRALNAFVDLVEVLDELLLLGVLAEHGGHLELELADDVRVDFGESGALDQVVELAESGVLGQALELLEQVLRFELEQLAHRVVVERLVPERADVDARHLGRVQHLAQRPHERAVDAHQLLVVDHVGLVEHDADLLVVAAQHLDAALELVGDVELVGVEEEQDAIAAFGEPLEHGDVVVAALESLLLAGQDARRVDEREALEHLVGHLAALEAVEERVAELGQRLEVLLGVDDERVARHGVLVLVVHDGDERVGGRLGTDAYARKVRLEYVAYERGLAGRVLADEQYHRLRVEVGVLERRRVKVVELVGLLERQQLGLVDLLEAVDDRLERVILVLLATKVLEHCLDVRVAVCDRFSLVVVVVLDGCYVCSLARDFHSLAHSLTHSFYCVFSCLRAFLSCRRVEIKLCANFSTLQRDIDM